MAPSSRQNYATQLGPTTGVPFPLAATDLICEIERVLTVPGHQLTIGTARNIRHRIGMQPRVRHPEALLHLVIINVIIIAPLLGIIGFIDVPIVHQSVVSSRSLHPEPVVPNERGPPLPDVMLETLLVNLVAYSVLHAHLLVMRVRVANLEAAVAEEKRQVALLKDKEVGVDEGLHNAQSA